MPTSKTRVTLATALMTVAGVLSLVGVYGLPLYPTTVQEAVTASSTAPWVEQPKPAHQTVTAPTAEVETPPVAAEEPQRVEQPTLTVPSLNVSVPLGTVSPDDGVVTPPNFGEAFTVQGWSANTPTEGATYVIFHSRRNGTGIGNSFFNQQTGESRIHVGATVVVAGVEYTVDSTFTSPISDLHQNGMWTDTPGRLYLVTCLQNAQRTTSTTNFVVVATIKQ